MAKQSKSAAVAAPVANPMAQLVAAVTAPVAAPVPKVHSLAVGATSYVAANHVATFKGSRPVNATIAAHSYTLGGKAYAPAANHINAVQWQAVQAAIAANGGSATVAQIAAQFATLGLAAGLASGFVAYRAKAGSLAQVAAS